MRDQEVESYMYELTTRIKLEAQLKEAIEVIEFYGDFENYRPAVPPVMCDAGGKARDFIDKHKKGDGRVNNS